MTRIILDNRVRIPQRVLTRELREEIVARFTYANPDARKAKAFGFRKRISPTITTARNEREYLSVPRGGFDVVRTTLQAHDRWMRIEDRRCEGTPWKAPALRWPLYSYQETLVDIAMEKRSCLWRSPQASGKTMSAIGFAARRGVSTLVIVYTGNLLDQWVRRVDEQLGSSKYVGVIQGSRRELAPITVAMQQTLWRIPPEELRAMKFGCVIADEVQLFASATFSKVIDSFDAAYLLGVSGDERRADGKEFLIYDQFGEVAAEVHHEDLVDAGFVHEVEVRVVPTTFRADWYTSLPSVQAKVKLWDKLLAEIGADEERNALVGSLTKTCVEQAGQALVLSSRREHCHALDMMATSAGFRSGLLIGGNDYRAQFNATLERMMRGECQVAVGTLQAIGVGFDLPSIARGIIAVPVATSAKGRMQWQQFRGRFARTAQGKENAVLYYLHDESVFGIRPIENLNRWNRKVCVLDDEQWVDAGQWLKERRAHEKAKQQRREEPGFDFLTE